MTFISKRNLIWGGILSAVLFLCAAVYLLPKEDAEKTAVIRQGNRIIRTIDLSASADPVVFQIEAPAGGVNTILVQNGQIGITQADCPDQICVNRGMIRQGAPIVCLPHQLSITIEDKNSGADAVTGG